MSIYLADTININRKLNNITALKHVGFIDKYTKLLIPMNGINDSNVFTDIATGKAITTNGDAKISTAQSKFNGSSLILDGNGDYLSVEDSTDFAFGTGAFIVDFYTYILSTPAFGTFFDTRSADNANVGISIGSNWLGTNDKKIYIYVSTANIQSDTLNLNQWYHISVIGNGGATGNRNIKLYIDGILIGTYSNDYNFTEEKCKIGSYGAVGLYSNCHMNMLRVSKGIERWTENFVIPNYPYV